MMPLTIVCGHYGVGKSEFAIALALATLDAGRSGSITLIDLDVVNPYFRSREARAVLENRGISVIGNSLGIDSGVDVPAIPGSVVPALHNRDALTIIDLGGDPVGARALRQFRPHVAPEDTDLLYLVNACRPDVADLHDAERYLREIEAELSLACTGLVNNTHLLHETRAEHLRRGDALCADLAARTGIPVRYHSATHAILGEVAGQLAGQPITITQTLREEWMSQGNQHTERPRSRRHGFGARR